MLTLLLLLVSVCVAQPRGADLDAIATTKATCPFIGSVVKSGMLRVSGSVANPFARVADIRQIGNLPSDQGFGQLLEMFAIGNHGAGNGQFSLNFPFSQGSHAGDSNILQRNLNRPSFDQSAFFAFSSYSRGKGFLTPADVGKFIALNVKSDRAARTVGRGTITTAAADLVRLLRSALFARDRNKAISDFTRLLAVDNIAGSAGEFALMFSLFNNRNDGRQRGVIYVDEMQAMFRDKRIPRGWESWLKKRNDWLLFTLRLSLAAYAEYAKM